MKKSLTLVVPVYNEIGAIENSINHLTEIKKSCTDFQLEIILVNDGSTDGTEEILKGLSKNKTFKVIHHAKNTGYGSALKTGVRAAKSPYIAITDADETYPDELIPEFFRDVVENNHDMLVGARTGETVKIPLIRRPAKWFITRLASYMVGTRIPDLNSGLRIMKKEVVEKYIHLLPEGFSFTSTISLAMLANGYDVKYVPINYHHRKGNSKIRPIYDTLNFIKLIIRTVMLFDPLRVFLPISLPLLFGGIVLIAVQAIMYMNISTVAVLIMLTGLNILTIGMLAEVIVSTNKD